MKDIISMSSFEDETGFELFIIIINYISYIITKFIHESLSEIRFNIPNIYMYIVLYNIFYFKAHWEEPEKQDGRICGDSGR